MSWLQPIVIDNGSGTIKLGFAGAETPGKVFPAFVGRTKLPKVMSGGELDGNLLVGDKANQYRGILKLTYPIKHGVVGANGTKQSKQQDWGDMQKLWEYSLSELQVQSTEQHPVLLTEAANNPRANKGKTAEIFFESFSSPALYIQCSAILSLYASGRVTGVVLDSGDGVTSTVPVYEGFALPHAIQRTDVAGRDVTEYLQLLLRKGGSNLHTSAEMEIIKQIKEDKCHIAFDIKKAESEASEDSDPAIPYTLPDGQVIDIHAEKFRAPEILFNPSLIGLEYDGMHECVAKALAKSDLDIRKKLFSTILLSGGSTLFDGLGDRLLKEIREISPRDTKIKIYAPRTRLYSTWVGGSILANLQTFKKMWVTRKEFEEHGKRVIYRKCF